MASPAAAGSRLRAALPWALGAVLGLALGLVLGIRACGLPLAPGWSATACVLEVRQDASAGIVSAREVARDVAGSSEPGALLSSGVAGPAWAVAWAGGERIVLVASAATAQDAAGVADAATGRLAASVSARSAAGDAFSLGAAAHAGATPALVMADRLAGCAVAGALVGALAGGACSLARRALAAGREGGDAA